MREEAEKAVGIITSWAGPIYVLFCHLAVPAVFIAAGYLHYCDRSFLRWEVVALLAFAVAPFFLKLLRFYRISSIGKDGLAFDADIAPSQSTSGPDFTSNPQQGVLPPSAPTRFSDLTRPARKVLRTLWRFQNESFGDEVSNRWAFVVSPLAPDFQQFSTGCSELRRAGLIQDQQSMVLLSDGGILFCRKHANALAGGGEIWDKFGAAT